MRWIKRARKAASRAATGLGRLLGPAWTGFLQGFGLIAGAAASFAYLAIISSLPVPSPGLFESLAQVGVGLFVAYSVTIASVTIGTDTEDDHVNWLAFGCGSALAGLVGIGISVAFSTSGGNAIAGDIRLAGVSWAATAFALQGIAISLGPLMIFRSRQAKTPDSK